MIGCIVIAFALCQPGYAAPAYPAYAAPAYAPQYYAPAPAVAYYPQYYPSYGYGVPFALNFNVGRGGHHRRCC
jgi:hypothetical protein